LKEAQIDYSGTDLDFVVANRLASSFAAKELAFGQPVLVAWHDKKTSRMSPAIEGGDIRTRWHDYGESHGGQVSIAINGEYDFVFADASAFEQYGPSPYINLHDEAGNEYVCNINALRDPHVPDKEACVLLDDWMSKQT
jgi:Domain of unknown function (DUF5619)